MVYPIVVYGDPVLKKQARKITQEEIDIKQLSQDMFETMQQANGVGLAAPQIGKSIRLFVVDGTNTEDDSLEGFKKVFVNPQILEEEGERWSLEEGCLSIPGVREEVLRQEKLKIRYFDEDWNEHEETFNGMKARIIQHEYDHIEGILFTDHISPLKRRMLKGKLNDISRGKNVKLDYKMRFPHLKK